MSSITQYTGTPQQWWNTLKQPDKWLSTEWYSEQNDELVSYKKIEEDNKAAAAAAQAVADQQAAQAAEQAAKEKSAAEAKAAADAAAAKIAADKAAEEKASQDAATLLATRRRTSSVTPSGAKGVLGQAPVKLKTLLGS